MVVVHVTTVLSKAFGFSTMENMKKAMGENAEFKRAVAEFVDGPQSHNLEDAQMTYKQAADVLVLRYGCKIMNEMYQQQKKKEKAFVVEQSIQRAATQLLQGNEPTPVASPSMTTQTSSYIPSMSLDVQDVEELRAQVRLLTDEKQLLQVKLNAKDVECEHLKEELTVLKRAYTTLKERIGQLIG